VDAALISAIAALIAAAVGLAAKFVSSEQTGKPSKLTGKPWMVGVVALAIVGLVLLLVTVWPGHDQPPDGDQPDLVKVYQSKVVPICTEDREGELAFKHQMEQIQTDLISGDASTIYSIAKLMTDAIIEEQGRADRLEALDPPSDLEPVQSEAVSMWRRKIAVSRENKDQIEKWAGASGGDVLKFAQDLQHLDYTDESRLESQKDVLLRKLGGSGCKPSPSP
jgi:hypothetical protein